MYFTLTKLSLNVNHLIRSYIMTVNMTHTCCWFLFVLFLHFLISNCYGKTVFYHLTAEYFEAAPDGVPRKVKGFNHLLPGPTIRARKGDTLTIKVTNLLSPGEMTTVHWHGYEHYLNPWQDGPYLITQCGIPYNHTFTYKFIASQSGTYWYHSHHSGQYGDGLWGVMIIENTPEVHRYDGEFVIAANVWFHRNSEELFSWYEDTHRSKGELPYPDSVLINGIGNYLCQYARLRNISSCNEKRRYPIFEVEEGKTYRFRFVEASVITSKYFSIDGHKLETIETDGVDTVRVKPVDVAHCSTGTRHSFLVKMTKPKIDQDEYFIRVNTSLIPYRMKYENINQFPEAFETEAKAILRYKKNDQNTNSPTTDCKDEVNVGAFQGRPEPKISLQKWPSILYEEDLILWVYGSFFYKEDPVRASKVLEIEHDSLSLPNPIRVPKNSTALLDIMDCNPFGDEEAPSWVNQTINLFIPNLDDPNYLVKPGFNNITYSVATLDKPALVKMIKGEKLPESINPVTVNGFGENYVVELIINDYGDSGHPIHLHGHTFWVMGFGQANSGPFNETRDRPSLKSGVRRETASVAYGSWLVLRFRANNPGLWLLHCHMNFHAEVALGLVLVEGEKLAKEAFKKVPDEVAKLCELSGIQIAVSRFVEKRDNVMLPICASIFLVIVAIFVLVRKIRSLKRNNKSGM